MTGLFHLWSEWEVQILIIFSFALQVFLFSFAGIRRRNISRGLRDLLWLLYLLAESIATYTIGHMSISCKPGEHHQLMAFWAPFLLVHLGGQDTITAYAMEDNNLWGRHLLTLVVQAMGVAYVLYKYISGDKTLVMAGVLMLTIGVVKYGERVWALKSSKLDNISKFLDKAKMENLNEPYSPEGVQLGDEEILQGAQDLLYICMGQFADYKVWPSKFQSDIIKHFHEKGKLFELIETQLTLMHEIFYTKAQVIHTCCGYWIRVFTLLGTVTALLLFQFAGGKDVYNIVDVIVTYILLVGASLLEMASVLRAILSTWACAMLKANKKCVRLHSMLVFLRQKVKARRLKRTSGFAGQLNLVESYLNHYRAGLRSRVVSYWRKGSSEISVGSKDLVLKEILKLARACGGDEDVMRSYRGQCTLKRHDEDGSLEEQLGWSTRMEFDDAILQWHYATNLILHYVQLEHNVDAEPTIQAIGALSNYMMFLFAVHPHLLPGPVRLGPYLEARENMNWGDGYLELLSINMETEDYWRVRPVLVRGATIAGKLRRMKGDTTKLLELLLGVWVEMLCYAAHHCNRDSHARQLNDGGEFITVVWLMTTTTFNCVYCGGHRFEKSREEFFSRRSRSSISGLLCICLLCLILQCCCNCKGN